MSYTSRNLSVLAYANGFTLWHYLTEDKPEQVLAETKPLATPYWYLACDMLRTGDLILCNFTTTASAELLFVNFSRSDGVLVTSFTKSKEPANVD